MSKAKSIEKSSKPFPTSLLMLSIFLSMIATLAGGWVLASHYGPGVNQGPVIMVEGPPGGKLDFPV